MLHNFTPIIIIMFWHMTRCSLLENRKLKESVDLLEAKFKLEKRYRQEEFEILLTKLNDIDATLKKGLTNSAVANSTAVCRGEVNVSALQRSNRMQDKDIKILQAAFRHEKEENQKYRHSLVALEQTVDNLVSIVQDFKQELGKISFAVEESFATTNQCNIWRNEVNRSVATLDIKMDETMASLKSLDYMEFVVNVLNDTKTNMAISQMCTKKPKQYSSCKEILRDGFDESGGYVVYPSEEIGEVKVYCDQVTDGGGWTVFQRRLNGSVSFYRNWSDYKSGFGDTEGEFWLGNDVIHTMLSTGDGELRIELENFEGSRAYAEYDKFSIGDESSGYKLEVGKSSGTAGDSLNYHNGMKFSTEDRDNDIWVTGDSCAKKFKGSWWYKSCYRSNLNGVYHNTEEDKDEDGIVWSSWKGFYKSMKFVEMKFR